MKLLQIAYHYPPMGGAGVQRALKFSKYLPDFGIQPVVLAARESGYLSDASLLDELSPELRVERIPHRPLLGRLRTLLGSAPRVSSARPTAVDASACHGVSGDRTRQKIREAALKVYVSSQFPDDKAGWARRAFAPACDLVRAEQIDLILATAPSYSALGLAARVAAATGRPWVADYRDLWTDNPNYPAAAWRRPVDRWMESRWLASAQGVIAVTPLMQRSLAERLDGRCPVAFIPNGYDEADFIARAPAHKAPGVFRIVHAGTFYGRQSPEVFIEALALCLQHDPIAAGRLRVRFVGAIGDRFAPALGRFAQAWPGVLECTGFLRHGDAVAESLAADVLLLVIGGGAAARGVLTGKLFEYLRIGRPVLFLGPNDGDAADLLRNHGRFEWAPADDCAAIASALSAFLRGKDLPQRPADARPERFERRALTGELADFLRACLNSTHERT
jgi:hypothetical protein